MIITFRKIVIVEDDFFSFIFDLSFVKYTLSMKNRIALIPSYEPDFNLLNVVNELIDRDFNVVVVNDGSNPSFDEIFKQLPSGVNYLSYEANRGKGFALKYGFAYIKEHFNSDSIIVTLDSDGQHRVNDAIKICDVCEKEGGFVLGSRYFGKGTPGKSRFGNFMARTLFLLSTHHKIYDTQTGLRAFDYSLLERMINVKGNRYEYEMNVLLDIVRNDIPVKEETIETIYVNNNAGTHYSPFKDTMRIFKELLKFSASSLIGFLVDYAAFALLTLIPCEWAYWLLACNVIARVISASVNFTINYVLVFRSDDKVWKAVIKYAILAVFILACNTFLLWLLVEQAGLNKYLAKVIVEITMFITSWLVQRLFVFRKKKK